MRWRVVYPILGGALIAAVTVEDPAVAPVGNDRDQAGGGGTPRRAGAIHGGDPQIVGGVDGVLEIHEPGIGPGEDNVPIVWRELRIDPDGEPSLVPDVGHAVVDHAR